MRSYVVTSTVSLSDHFCREITLNVVIPVPGSAWLVVCGNYCYTETNRNLHQWGITFPPVSAVKGIISVPSERSRGWTVWCTDPKFGGGVDHDMVENMIFVFSDGLTCACSLCHVMRHHGVIWCLLARKLTRRAQRGRASTLRRFIVK